MGQPGPVGGHEVLRGHGPQRAHVLVGALVAHDAHGHDRQQHGEALGGGAVPAAGPELLDEDGVGVLQDLHPLRADAAGNAHRQAGAGEGVAPDHVLGQAQGQAHPPHLVLEQLAQGLHQLQLHEVGQAAHVVVGFHQHGAADAGALDHVGIQGALGQEVGLELARLPVEHVDEDLPDDLALGFGVADPRQGPQEFRPGVLPADLHVERGEGLLHLELLVLAHDPGVHEHAGELLADGLVQQQGGDAGVHPAGQPQHHPAVAHLGADVLEFLLDEVARVPVQLHVAGVQEVAQDGGAVGGVGHLRMELDGEAP